MSDPVSAVPQTDETARSTPSDGALAYIRGYYGVPASLGQRVVADGKPGVIIGGHDAHIVIALDGVPGATYWHPTWRMEYVSA